MTLSLYECKTLTHIVPSRKMVGSGYLNPLTQRRQTMTMYYGTAMEAKRIKAFAKLAELEFVGNV